MEKQKPRGLLYYDKGRLNPVRRDNRAFRRIERRNPDDFTVNWAICHSRSDSYTETFQAELGNVGFDSILKQAAEQRGRTAILDLMASDTLAAEAVEHLGFDFGVAVSLGYRKTHHGLSRNALRNLNLDLTYRDSWKKIRQTMLKAGYDGFDVVVSRPEGGIVDTRVQLSTYFYMLQEAWSLVTKEDGLLCFQVPLRYFPLVEPYFQSLRQSGVDIRWSDEQTGYLAHSAVIRKTPDSPKRLPTFKMLKVKEIYG